MRKVLLHQVEFQIDASYGHFGGHLKGRCRKRSESRLVRFSSQLFKYSVLRAEALLFGSDRKNSSPNRSAHDRGPKSVCCNQLVI